jgi:hypothetical protein
MARSSSRAPVAAAIPAGACVLALALAACGSGHDPRHVATPPPLARDHPSDVHRLLFAHRPPDVPPVGPSARVRRSDGSQVAIALLGFGYHRMRGGVGVRIWTSAYRDFFEKPGRTFSAYGVRVTVLRVWNMPGEDHDAADVRIDLVATYHPGRGRP